MSNSPLPVQRWRKLGKCLSPVLALCLLATGCSLFRHEEQSPLDKPITAEKHRQYEEQAKPSWFESLFGTTPPPKAQTMGAWVGQPKPAT
jgi:hypothetical protein